MPILAVYLKIETLISFKNAYASDPISAFGGVIACNYKINKKLHKKSVRISEVILAKGFDKTSLEILKKEEFKNN